MAPTFSSERRSNRLILFALWIVFYCSFTLFAPPLLDDADSVHAEVAREMLVRHDFVTLYANGIRYLEKAPLYYWAMAAGMRVFGATTAASRLPLAFAVLALALLLEAFARRAFSSPRAGLYAGLITLSSFGIFIFSRINIPDVLVCVFLCVSLYAFHLTEVSGARSQTVPSFEVGSAEPSRLLCWTFSTAVALNILTKGLIGIVFPVAVVALYLLATRGWRGALRRLSLCHPWSSAAILLAIAVPWHVLVALANPGHGHPGDLARVSGHWQVPYPTDGNVHGWAWFYFINEQLYRYLNVRVPHDYDTSPLWLFYGLIFVWLMPWSAFLPAAIVRSCASFGVPHLKRLHRLRWGSMASSAAHLRNLARPERTNLFLILWAAVPLLFFSLSTRQEYYVLPSLPPLILLIANFLTWQPPNGREAYRHLLSLLFSAMVLTFLGLCAAAACVFFIFHAKTPAPGTDISSLLTQNPGNYALSFGHFLDLNAQALGLFRTPLALTAIAFGLILPAAVAFGAAARYFPDEEKHTGRSGLLLAASAFLFLIAAHQGLVIFSPTLTSYQLARSIAPQLHPGDMIAIHGEYEAGSTLGFYLRRNDLHIVEGRSSNLWYGSFFPDAPPIFETRESIARKWTGPQRIFLWQDPSDTERPPLELPGTVYVIGNSGGKQILSNQAKKVDEHERR